MEYRKETATLAVAEEILSLLLLLLFDHYLTHQLSPCSGLFPIVFHSLDIPVYQEFQHLDHPSSPPGLFIVLSVLGIHDSSRALTSCSQGQTLKLCL